MPSPAPTSSLSSCAQGRTGDLDVDGGQGRQGPTVGYRRGTAEPIAELASPDLASHELGGDLAHETGAAHSDVSGFIEWDVAGGLRFPKGVI